MSVSNFTVTPQLFAKSEWLKFSLNVVNKLLKSEDQCFLHNLFVSAIKQVFSAAATVCPDDSKLLAKAQEIIHTLSDVGAIKVEIGICPYCVHAQSNPSQNTIVLNSEWSVQSEKAYEAYLRGDFGINTDTVCDNIVFTVVKLLRGIFHLLTKHILLYEAKMRDQLGAIVGDTTDGSPQKKVRSDSSAGSTGPATEVYRGTPIMVGTKNENGQHFSGDMGCCMEQLLFGNNFRLRMDRNNWNVNSASYYFEQVTLTQLERKDSTSSSRVRALPPDVQYMTTCYRQKNTHQYMMTIFNAMQAVHDAADGLKGGEGTRLLSLFAVDLTDCEEITSMRGCAETLPVPLFSRKYMPMFSTESVERNKIDYVEPTASESSLSEGDVDKEEVIHHHGLSRTTDGRSAKI